MKRSKASWQKKKKDIWLLFTATQVGQPLPVLVVAVRSLELQANISDQIMHIESQHLTWGSFFITVEFCLQKVLDLKISFCAL